MLINLDTPLLAISGASRFLPKLKKLGIHTVRDLLWHFPARYEDFSNVRQIADVIQNEEVTICGTIEEIEGRHSFRRRLYVVEALITDESGSLRAVWFNQPYIRNTLTAGKTVNLSGKIALRDGELYLSNPTYEFTTDNKKLITKHTARIVPIYPETKGLTSKGIRYLIYPILKTLKKIPETLPAEILKDAHMPDVNAALSHIHFPKTIDDALAAKKRFAFEDLFFLQLHNVRERLKLAEKHAPPFTVDLPSVKQRIVSLPFELTLSQKKSLWEILQDLEKTHPMNRLLQGDVGSGKTIVAAIAAIETSRNGYQTAFMAPTEILARQHYRTITQIFADETQMNAELTIALLTGSESKVFYGRNLETDIKKQTLREHIAAGKIKIIIGTHALIQQEMAFHNLALVIVDEQHRFGVSQRAALARRSTQINTQIDADTNSNDNFLYKDLTYTIRGIIFDVYNTIGPGHKEIIYHNALKEEFTKRGLIFDSEKIISIEYNNKKIGVYKPDFIIENKILLEIKALSFIGKIEERQLWNYLKGSEYKLALIANFGNRELQIKRVVYDIARDHLRKSASHLRKSALVTPNLLSMSATPIPRTLSLTLFGDLDLSLITELPKNRKPIITNVVSPDERKKTYDFIRTEVKKGRQVFVICPRIDSVNTQINADGTQINADTNARINADQNADKRRYISENLRGNLRESALPWETKAVKEEYEKLSKKIFPDLKVAMLHGKLKPKEKEKIMSAFANGAVDILVATSVVEVGVDVPNAAIMMIEGSERFGLAQLYQFRGRVGRGEHQSYCFLFTDSTSRTTHQRLKSIVEAKNGFELAEKDLKIRGPGEFFGTSQTGIPDLAMKAIQNPELVKTARDAAMTIIKNDPTLARHPLLLNRLEQFQREVHFE